MGKGLSTCEGGGLGVKAGCPRQLFLSQLLPRVWCPTWISMLKLLTQGQSRVLITPQ